MIFAGGYIYRFTRSDGSHRDYTMAGIKNGDTVWRDDTKTEHTGAVVFKEVVQIDEAARPPKAVNELR